MNLDIIGCVWTGEFDLNTLRVDVEIFESRKKKLRIQKYPDTCGRGLNITHWGNVQEALKQQLSSHLNINVHVYKL